MKQEISGIFLPVYPGPVKGPIPIAKIKYLLLRKNFPNLDNGSV